jgi:membrane associated rhomboid family serine protease
MGSMFGRLEPGIDFIDNAAHLGGVATGAMLAVAMAPRGIETARRAETLDTAGWIASVILAAGAVFTMARLLG